MSNGEQLSQCQSCNKTDNHLTNVPELFSPTTLNLQ